MAGVREACMRELQSTASVLTTVIADLAGAIEGGSERQPSAQLIGVCCNALDPLLGASKLTFGRSVERLQPARTYAWCLSPLLHAALLDCAGPQAHPLHCRVAVAAVPAVS